MSYPVNITIKLEKNKVDQLFGKEMIEHIHVVHYIEIEE